MGRKQWDGLQGFSAAIGGEVGLLMVDGWLTRADNDTFAS